MKIWIDAQLSPGLAPWISENFAGVEAFSVKFMGLRDAEDQHIFLAARDAGAIVMTKDQDFVALLDQQGPPPKIIWITCGNTSNAKLKSLLEETLPPALSILQKENLIEISD